MMKINFYPLMDKKRMDETDGILVIGGILTIPVGVGLVILANYLLPSIHFSSNR